MAMTGRAGLYHHGTGPGRASILMYPNGPGRAEICRAGYFRPLQSTSLHSLVHIMHKCQQTAKRKKVEICVLLV